MGSARRHLVSVSYSAPNSGPLTVEVRYKGIPPEFINALMMAVELRLPFPYDDNRVGIPQTAQIDREMIDTTVYGQNQKTYLTVISADVVLVPVP